MNNTTIQCPSCRCSNNKCNNFILRGYNCAGNDNENKMAPYGHTTQQEFIEIYIKAKKRIWTM